VVHAQLGGNAATDAVSSHGTRCACELFAPELDPLRDSSCLLWQQVPLPLCRPRVQMTLARFPTAKTGSRTGWSAPLTYS